MKNIKFNILSVLMCCLFFSCYEDKGNYDYTEVPQYTFSNVQESYTLLRGVDIFTFAPKIVSSTEGEITADNPNFEYSCRIGSTSGSFDDSEQWHDLNPDKTQSFTCDIRENVGSYIGVYTITDKRTGVSTNYTFDITLSSTSYEGWLVLCNEGSENRVRLDMISVISQDRIIPIHDIMNSTFPEQHNAKQIAYDPSLFASGEYIYMLTETGSFRLQEDELTADEKDDISSEFLGDLGDDKPIRFGATGYWMAGAGTHLMVTKNGDFYTKGLGASGASYEFLCNTSVEGNDREYRVAPYIGTGMERPGTTTNALLFDIDNKRFIGWDETTASTSGVCYEVPESGANFISFNCGQDLVYMEGTRFANNTVFAVLQNAAGERSVCAINLSDDKYTQENYYENIQAENFRQAEHFTFHSQYPYMFYSYQNQLYSYNLGTKALNKLTLDGEEITMVKIDLFKSLSLTNIPEEVLPQQHYVLVGSYKTSATDNNGGILRMYKLDNATGGLQLVKEYDGFAKIVDVTYRERF